jgi:hypothetical protein
MLNTMEDKKLNVPEIIKKYERKALDNLLEPVTINNYKSAIRRFLNYFEDKKVFRILM